MDAELQLLLAIERAGSGSESEDLESSGWDALDREQQDAGVEGAVTFISLTDDSLLRIGAMLVEEHWQDSQRTAFLETYTAFNPEREAQRWKRTSADDMAAVALRPLRLANRRLRQICDSLARKSVEIKSESDLAEAVEAGTTVRAVRFLDASPATITKALDALSNVTDIALCATLPRRSSPQPTMQLMLALGTIHGHRVSSEIRSIQLFGGPFDRSSATLKNLHPFSLGCLATFKNLTSLSLRLVIRSTDGDHSDPADSDSDRFVAQLEIVALCPSLQELDLLVSPPDWEASWGTISHCRAVKRLTITSLEEEEEIPAAGLRGLLALFPNVLALELRLRSPMPSITPPTLSALQELRISGTSLSSALAFVQSAGQTLKRLHVHDQDELFKVEEEQWTRNHRNPRRSHDEMKDRTFKVLEVIRRLKAYIKSNSSLRDLTLHVHRRPSPDWESVPLDEECEELLEGMVGKACSLKGVKYTLVIHP